LNYRAEIDGLRALAVVPVILFHAGFELFSGGYVGVDVFFVISGYLITTILVEDIELNRFSIASFYERRARRILPALYCVMFVSAIASLIVLYPAHLISFSKSLIATPLFASNFYFWSERGYFGGLAELKPLIHTWSLAVEEQFYIVFPVFLLLLKKYVKTFFILLFLSFVLSLISSYYVTLLHFDTAFYFPVTRAWELLFGAFAALILKRRDINLGRWWADLISLFSLSLIFYSFFKFNSETLFPSLTALVPVGGTFLFILSAQHSYLVKKVFSGRAIVFVGLISFSLYLWHQPIFALARQINLFDNYLFILLVLVFILSCFTYFFVEKPFRDKSVISLKTVLSFSIVGAVAFIALGAFVISKNGFPNRFEVEDGKLLTQLSKFEAYIRDRFDAIHHAEFREESKTKVVVIGDSFAKDFLNIIVESGRFDSHEFSAHEINEECGNLFLSSYEAIERYIPFKRRERCKVLGRYENENLLKLMNDADEIWVVASWLDWVVDLLPQSIDKLNQTFNKPVRVFGNKNFGKFEPYALLDLPIEERAEYVHAAVESTLQVSRKLDDKMRGYQYYYSLLDPLCGGSGLACKIFTPDGLLISVDGEHLTKEGAVESAFRLSDILSQIGGSNRQ